MPTINPPRKGEVVTGRCVVAWSSTGAGFVGGISGRGGVLWTQDLRSAQRFAGKGEIVAAIGDRQIEIFGIQSLPCETTMAIAGNAQRIKIERAVVVAEGAITVETLASAATKPKGKKSTATGAPLLDVAGNKPKADAS